MKKYITIALAITLTAFAYVMLKAETVVIDYSHGWTKGYVLELNVDSATFSLLDRNSGKKYISTAENPKNTLEYISELLNRIPKDSLNGFAIDGEVYAISLTINPPII